MPGTAFAMRSACPRPLSQARSRKTTPRHERGCRRSLCVPSFPPARFLLGQAIGSAEKPGHRIDVERLPPERGNPAPSAVDAARLDRHEISEVIAHMLLNG